MSAYVPKKEAAGEEAPAPELHLIRITLTSRNVKKIETVCSKFKATAVDQGIKVKGPVRMPTKKLRITTRKAPSGEGTNTWDKFEMRIHKRLLDLHDVSSDKVKTITGIELEAGVEVDVTIVNRK